MSNILTKAEFQKTCMQPIINVLTDVMYDIYVGMEKTLPENMPLDQRKAILKSVCDSQANIVTASMQAVKPADFESAIKEQLCKMNS